MDELPNPITRSEQYLAKIAGAEPTLPTPITREERYLAKIAGEDVDIPPAPITRTEQYLAAIVEGGGGGGGTVAPEKDVSFIDYDGTIRYSYTADEFATLTEMPANPEHKGLTAQGWNWSLSDAKTYVASYGKLWIGQYYITDDGKTRIYIHLDNGRLSPMLGCCPDGTVVVDWGDGSETETLTGTSLTTPVWTSTHNYASAGDYVITLNVTSGEVALSGTGTQNEGAYLLRYSASGDNRNYGYRNAIRHVELGSAIRMSSHAFSNCNALTSITIPDREAHFPSAFYNCYALSSFTAPPSLQATGTFGASVFFYCYSLSRVSIPNGVKVLSNYTFQSCIALSSVTMPSSMTAIRSTVFSDCRALSNITIPDGVTSIDTNAFFRCYSLGEIHFKPTTPPTVSNTNAWDSLPTDCKIYVPAGSLSAYTSASNYPDPSAYTYIEE